jgi:hypothetical protein
VSLDLCGHLSALAESCSVAALFSGDGGDRDT